jgi:large subunit ribosomal protein L6
MVRIKSKEMSYIGKKPIKINENVKVNISSKNDEVTIVLVDGPLGTLSLSIPNKLNVFIEKDNIIVFPKDTKKSDALWGTYRSLISNMIFGVSEGFEKILELVGVGYRANVIDNLLILRLGYTHSIEYHIPETVKVEIYKSTTIRIFGIDKANVAHVASTIRNLKRPDSYKGKGIRYSFEKMVLKQGKK